MGRFDLRTRTGQISAIIQGNAASSVDADAQAFFDRVTAAGGTLTTTEKDAVSALVLSLKTNGTWTAMKAVYPMVGSSAAACAQNLKSSSFTGTFTSGWTFASTGVTPNGTSAYMDTGLNDNSILSLNSLHISIYLRTNTDGVICDIGTFSASANSGINIFSRLSNTQYVRLHDEDTNVVATTDSRGFRMGTRNSATTKNNFINSTKTTFTQSSNTKLNLNIWIGGRNSNFELNGFYSNRENSFTSIGDGITDTQATDLYNAVQTFQTSLSRQV